MATILIVDDQFDTRMMMRLWLELAAHEVHEAEDGQAGLEMVLELQPDLTLMDMHMPVMDGDEAVRLLRKSHGYTGLIVAATGSVQPADVQAALDAGCDGVIPKPIDEDFGERVQAFLDKK